MRNQFHVGSTGKRISVLNLPREPELTPDQALELAAWLVATAVPLRSGAAGDELNRFLKLLIETSGETELSAAVEKELET